MTSTSGSSGMPSSVSSAAAAVHACSSAPAGRAAVETAVVGRVAFQLSEQPGPGARAAACSACFFERPSPDPRTAPSSFTSAKKRLAWSGPSDVTP